MFNSLREELETTVTPLLRDIIDDARTLMQQEAQLVRAEVREEASRMRQGFTLIIAGGVLLVISVALCALMTVQLISTEWFSVPLWMSFGIVAVVVALAGGVLSYIGGKKLEAMRESSERSMRALGEGMKWMQRTM
jgi:CHASE3 domain sensor protein